MATVTLPHSWSDGDIIYASEVMAQFNALKDELNGNLDASNITNSSITEDELDDSAVTNAKVASGIDAAKLADGSVSNTEFQYLSGVTSGVQAQLDAKSGTSHTHEPSAPAKETFSLAAGATEVLSAGLWSLYDDSFSADDDVYVEIKTGGSWEYVVNVPTNGCSVASDGANVRLNNTSGSSSITVRGFRFDIE